MQFGDSLKKFEFTLLNIKVFNKSIYFIEFSYVYFSSFSFLLAPRVLRVSALLNASLSPYAAVRFFQTPTKEKKSSSEKKRKENTSLVLCKFLTTAFKIKPHNINSKFIPVIHNYSFLLFNNYFLSGMNFSNRMLCLVA